MSGGAESRAAAARCIAAVMEGETLERALAEHSGDCPERDQPLLREFCYGTLRAFPRLEALLNQLLSRPLRKRDLELKALALVGLYQLDGMRTPDHAAVSATVDATARIHRKNARGLINAVLRRYLRESDALNAALPDAAAAALPQWLWDALGKEWPVEREAIAEACQSRPPLTLRVNRQHGSREAYAQRLVAQGISATAGQLSEDAFTLATGLDVDAIPGFLEGDVSVQDEAAQLAAVLLAPQPGERILDACAAPGGKSGHILELQPQAKLLACDINEERLQRISENAERLGLAIETLCADMTTPPPALTASGPFDAILLDVPCSATGVMRRHPDIKLLRRESDIAGFAGQQRALLESCWTQLKPGGRLLYVTCSVLQAENSGIVENFLAAHDDAQHCPITVPTGRPCTVGMQVLPASDASDGLYFAQLSRAGAAPGPGPEQ